MTKTLPVVGAALNIKSIDTHLPWLIERQRDLEIQDFTVADVLDGDWKSIAEAYKAKLDGYSGRMGIHGPFWGLPTASSDPEIRKVVSRRMMQAMEVAEHIGATHMVVHSPYTTWDYNHRICYADDYAMIPQLTQDTLGAAIKRGEEIGCTLVLENIEDKDPTVRVDLVKSFNSPAFKVSIDTGHAHYAHGNTGGPPVDYFVTAAGEDLAHIHLQDADGYADRHWQLGTGTVLWHSVFKALGTLTVKPRLIIELRDHADVIPSQKFLTAQGLAE